MILWYYRLSIAGYFAARTQSLWTVGCRSRKRRRASSCILFNAICQYGTTTVDYSSQWYDKKHRGTIAKVQFWLKSAHTSLAFRYYHTAVKLLYHIMLLYVTCLWKNMTVKKSRSHLVVLIMVSADGRCVPHAERRYYLLLGTTAAVLISHGCVDLYHDPEANTRGRHCRQFKSQDLCARKKCLN